MATTSNNFPLTAADLGGSYPWSNVNNIKAFDSAYAISVLDIPDVFTNAILASNFGFTIPAGATINGVVVGYSGYSDYQSGGGDASSALVTQLYFAGTIGTAKNASIAPTTLGQQRTVGTVSDVWGASLSAGLCNNVGFGVQMFTGISTADTYPVNFYLDYVKMQITYTPLAGGIPQTQYRWAWWVQ